jgi:hypothetical protein
MHNGWIANIGSDYRKVAMAMRITRRIIDNAIVDSEPEDFYFDAVTGTPLESPLPFKGHDFMPIDFDGDGYHEFYGTSGDKKGYIVDCTGKVHAFVGGDGVVRSGKVMRRPGEQLMVFYHDERKVRIWGDINAVESEYTKKRYAHSYHWRMQHFMGTGYNHSSSHITCGM